MNSRTPLDQIELIRNLLAFLLVGAFVSAIIVFTFKSIPEANRDLLTYMVGQLSGMATLALGFYFVNKVGQDALDAAKTENSAKAFEAITATAKATSADTSPDIELQPGETATVAAEPETKP